MRLEDNNIVDGLKVGGGCGDKWLGGCIYKGCKRLGRWLLWYKRACITLLIDWDLKLLRK